MSRVALIVAYSMLVLALAGNAVLGSMLWDVYGDYDNLLIWACDPRASGGLGGYECGEE